MSELPRIRRPGDPLYAELSDLNRRYFAALAPHRGKPGVEAAFAAYERRRAEVENMLRAEAAREGGDHAAD